MKLRTALPFPVVCISTLLLVHLPMSHAGVIWDVSINGPLSTNGNAPTVLPALTPGGNEIIGTIGQFFMSDFAAVASFAVPSGYELSNLVLDSYDYGTYYSYAPFSLYNGVTATGPTVAFWLITTFEDGNDLLSVSGPLSAGTYTFDIDSIQAESTLATATYALDLELSPLASIPEPCTMLLLGFGLAGLAVLKKEFRIALRGHNVRF